MATPASIGDLFAPKSQPLSFSIGSGAAPLKASTIFVLTPITGKIKQTHLKLLMDLRSSQGFTLKAFMGPPRFKQQHNNAELETMCEAENGSDIFSSLKDKFLSFKKNKFMEASEIRVQKCSVWLWYLKKKQIYSILALFSSRESIEKFQNLANAQAPKFMVIACADSRVCPSNILGFQPGEAFTMPNVANLVPPFESGSSETNAALEFAVNSLKVEHILVIGHSCCGGIRALMNMQDDANGSSFINSWVVAGKNARIKTAAAASDLSFDQQCRHCEKESINHSLLNLLTYPWIEEKVANAELFVHRAGPTPIEA